MWSGPATISQPVDQVARIHAGTTDATRTRRHGSQEHFQSESPAATGPSISLADNGASRPLLPSWRRGAEIADTCPSADFQVSWQGPMPIPHFMTTATARAS